MAPRQSPNVPDPMRERQLPRLCHIVVASVIPIDLLALERKYIYESVEERAIECKKKRDYEIGDGCQKYFSTFMLKTAFFISKLPQIFKITFFVNKI